MGIRTIDLALSSQPQRMRLRDGTLTRSATDLASFLGCRHKTARDMEAAAGLRERPHFDDPSL